MPDPSRLSGRFRKTLRDELARWRAEGLVTGEQADALTARYRLGDLARESTGALLMAIYVIGALLIAGGVVSFVAAHWDVLPAPVKIILIVAAMLACHGGGIYLWKVRADRPRLGHALVVLGTLIFGANIGLMAQIFHMHSNVYNGFAAWAVGALAMAYAVRSVPVAFIAVATSFIWLCGWEDDSGWAACAYPFLAAAAFIPFIYLKRSVLIAALALAAIALAMMAGAPHGRGFEWRIIALVAVGAGSLYAAAGLVALQDEALRPPGRVAVLLAAVGLAVMAYVLSFHGVAEDLRYKSWDLFDSPWAIPVGAAAILSIPLWALYAVRWPRAGALWPLGAGLFAGLALLAVAMALALANPTDKPHYYREVAEAADITAAILANAAGLALAVGLVAAGTTGADRRLFWAGVLLVVLLVVSRFFEYETGLLWKAAALLACGVGLILGGVKFESYLRQRRLADEQE